MPDEFVEMVSNRYIELFEMVTGEKFHKATSPVVSDRVEQNILGFLQPAN
jgi:phosphoribosylaminoimidazole-succinocarboxamide synthase